MPAWTHDRAEHLLDKNPSMKKSTAFAIATQQYKGKEKKSSVLGGLRAAASGANPKKDHKYTPAQRGALKRRFNLLADMMKDEGAFAGTAHKRIVIPKTKLTEGGLKQLGFVPVNIAIPEAGQDRFRSFRHPTTNYHIHSHPEGWTMHEDRHAAATMIARNRPKIKGKAKAFVEGLPHMSEEGLPGLYYYLKGQLSGHASTAQRVLEELPDAVKKRIDRLTPAFDLISSSLKKHPKLEKSASMDPLMVLTLVKISENETVGQRIRDAIESMYTTTKKKVKKVITKGEETGRNIAGRIGNELVDISKVQTPYRYLGKKSVEMAPKEFRAVVPKEVQQKWQVKEAQLQAFVDEVITGGNDPEFHLKVANELELKGVDAFTKESWAYSEYAGPRGEGPRRARQRSSIPPWVEPPIEKKSAVGVGAPMTRSQYSGPLSEGRFKMVSGIPPWMEPAIERAIERKSAPVEEYMVGLNKRAGMNTALGSMSPKGRLSQTQRVGAPKKTGFAGPSISSVSKPIGFGRKLPGTTKNGI